MDQEQTASFDLETVEGTRFLGCEFLVWMWYKSDLFGSEFELSGFGSIELWLDAQLVLESQIDSGERVTLKGMAPSNTPEALTALRQGKLPVKARISLNYGKHNYSFGFDAPNFSVSNLKIPAVVEEGDEAFFERMLLVEEFDQLLGALYEEFLSLRMTELWEGGLLKAIRDWVHEESTLTTQGYLDLLEQAQSASPNT